MDARPWYLEVDEGTLIAMATDVSPPSTTPRPAPRAGRHQPTPPGGPGSSSGLLAPVSPRDQHSPASPRDQHSPARATEPRPGDGPDGADRKSTRVNSSHVATSHAVCCLQN